MRVRNLILSAVAVGMMSSAAVATPLWEFTSAGNSFSNGSWDFGNNFQVKSTVTVTGLGYFADPNNGFVDANQVALYASTGTLLASATVDNTYPLVGHFRYVTISPVILTPGIYQIDGASHADNYTWNDPGFFTNPAIIYLGNTWHPDTSPVFQTCCKKQKTQRKLGPATGFGPPNSLYPAPQPHYPPLPPPGAPRLGRGPPRQKGKRKKPLPPLKCRFFHWPVPLAPPEKCGGPPPSSVVVARRAALTTTNTAVGRGARPPSPPLLRVPI